MERSLRSNKIFSLTMKELNFMNNMEWVMYNKLYNFFEHELPQIDGNIYLNTSIKECMKRLKGRNRPGEKTITKEYQKSLKQKHNKIFNEMNKNAVHQINGDPDLMNINNCNTTINDIDQWLNKLKN